MIDHARPAAPGSPAAGSAQSTDRSTPARWSSLDPVPLPVNIVLHLGQRWRELPSPPQAALRLRQAVRSARWRPPRVRRSARPSTDGDRSGCIGGSVSPPTGIGRTPDNDIVLSHPKCRASTHCSTKSEASCTWKIAALPTAPTCAANAPAEGADRQRREVFIGPGRFLIKWTRRRSRSSRTSPSGPGARCADRGLGSADAGRDRDNPVR